ncbi:hypothetical protein HK098_003013 [Nowakowskiella sp. JEL0407]|nr:hypothetical protein HK098_003013 [Nowakowskiella sp. JEL0407]
MNNNFETHDQSNLLPHQRQNTNPFTPISQPLAGTSTITRGNGIRRTLSRLSKRSYISNLSTLNRKNLARFGGSKITFLIFNSLVR